MRVGNKPNYVQSKTKLMNSMKLVIPLHSLYWSIHTKDESKRATAFAFIFGVNWLWRCGITASFGVLSSPFSCDLFPAFSGCLETRHSSIEQRAAHLDRSVICKERTDAVAEARIPRCHYYLTKAYRIPHVLDRNLEMISTILHVHRIARFDLAPLTKYKKRWNSLT